MYLKARPKYPKSGIDRGGPLRCPQHLQWIRGRACIIADCAERIIQACHVRDNLPANAGRGGMGKKPGDNWTVPMCWLHHKEQGDINEGPFERKYGINLVALAEKYAAASPHRWRWEQEE